MDKITVVNECENKRFTRKYGLPQVICNFTIKRNKLHDIPENKEWMLWLFGMSGMEYEAFTKVMGTGQYTFYFYPLCDDIERFELLLKYCVQFFIIDDHTECGHGDIARNQEKSLIIWTQFGEIFDNLEGKNSVLKWKWRPYIFSMHSCLEPMYRSFNDIQKKRFVEEWRLYIEGNLEETEFIHKGLKHKSVDELARIKIKSGAGRAVIQICEFADKIFVPQEVWDELRMQKILDLSALHMTIVNDIYSFEKEFKETKDLNKMFNMVALHSAIDGITVEESMVRVAKMVINMEEEIFELEDQLLKEPDCLQITKDFIDRINICNGANYKCNTFIDRYNKV